MRSQQPRLGQTWRGPQLGAWPLLEARFRCRMTPSVCAPGPRTP